MTAKEYLEQAYRLDKRINSHIKEKEELRAMASSISSPQLSADKVQSSPSGDAPFVRTLNKMWEMEEQIEREINILVDLKQQIHDAISTIPDINEQMVLRYRYVHNYSWEMISDEMCAGRATVIRWHDGAVSHFTVPENPIIIFEVETV